MHIKVKSGDKAITRRLIDQLMRQLSQLEPDGEYELEGILGAEYWDDEDDSHLAQGYFFSVLVCDGRVPFESAGWSGNRHNKYRYKP